MSLTFTIRNSILELTSSAVRRRHSVNISKDIRNEKFPLQTSLEMYPIHFTERQIFYIVASELFQFLYPVFKRYFIVKLWKAIKSNITWWLMYFEIINMYSKIVFVGLNQVNWLSDSLNDTCNQKYTDHTTHCFRGNKESLRFRAWNLTCCNHVSLLQLFRSRFQ